MIKRSLYTVEEIKEAVDEDREQLFAPYAVGRPLNWSVDQRTRDLVCIGNWLTREMGRLELDDLGRVMQQGVYSRASRSEEDLFVLATRIMNDVLEDKIDRSRKPHRRWG